MGGDDLLWRQAAALTRTANSRAEHKDGLPGGNRRYQVRDKFHWIAAIAIEKDQDLRVLVHSGDTSLDGAPVAALRLDYDAGAGGGCPLDRFVLRAAVHDNDFAHILGKYSGYDPCNCCFLIEAWNDC